MMSLGSLILILASASQIFCMQNFDGQQYFIRNAMYEKANLVQTRKATWPSDHCNVHYFHFDNSIMGGKGAVNKESCLMTTDVSIAGTGAGVLWEFQSGVHGFSGNAGYYYIRNVEFSDYRLYIKSKGQRLGLTKEYGNGIDDALLWKVVQVGKKGDRDDQQIFNLKNKAFPDYKVNYYHYPGGDDKPGLVACNKGCSGGNPSWLIIPRFNVTKRNVELRTEDNPSNTIQKLFLEPKEGMETTSSRSLSTTKGLTKSLELSLSKIGGSHSEEETITSAIESGESYYKKSRVQREIPPFSQMKLSQEWVTFKGTVDPDYVIRDPKIKVKCRCMKKYREKCEIELKKLGKSVGEC